jgi:AraC family transcriptional regulator, regulatory protein of adaptative response / methylated-DNA-[protein]-cysteine methyltransferase
MNSRSPNLPQLRQWLLAADSAPFLELARKKKSVLSQLTALSYDLDENVSLQAIRVTGMAAKIIAERDPEYIRNYLLRLFWLINDESGGICWKAPELIGEILHHCPQFSQFFPMLISLLDLEKEDAPRFRLGTMRAIGRVAQVRREAMLPALVHVQSFASGEQDVNTREMADWCHKQLVEAAI